MRIDRWKTIWSMALIIFFGGAVVSVFAGDGATPPSPTPAASDGAKAVSSKDAAESDSNVDETPAGCLADAATLEDLKRQKREIEGRSKDLAAREAELKARERALSDEMKKLVEARDELAKMDVTRKKENETKVAKLVETLEGMNPKAASALISSIDENLAIQTMTRLSTAKLSKVMNIMDPQRSTKLTELLAGVTRVKRSKSVSNDDAAEVTAERPRERALNPMKGGEKNDGKSHEQASSKSVSDTGDEGSTGGKAR